MESAPERARAQPTGGVNPYSAPGSPQVAPGHAYSGLAGTPAEHKRLYAAPSGISQLNSAFVASLVATGLAAGRQQADHWQGSGATEGLAPEIGNCQIQTDGEGTKESTWKDPRPGPELPPTPVSLPPRPSPLSIGPKPERSPGTSKETGALPGLKRGNPPQGCALYLKLELPGHSWLGPPHPHQSGSMKREVLPSSVLWVPEGQAQGTEEFEAALWSSSHSWGEAQQLACCRPP